MMDQPPPPGTPPVGLPATHEARAELTVEEGTTVDFATVEQVLSDVRSCAGPFSLVSLNQDQGKCSNDGSRMYARLLSAKGREGTGELGGRQGCLADALASSSRRIAHNRVTITARRNQ